MAISIKLRSTAFESKGGDGEKKERLPGLRTPGAYEVEVLDLRYISEDERLSEGFFIDFVVIGGDLDGQKFGWGKFPGEAKGGKTKDGKTFTAKQAAAKDAEAVQLLGAAILGLDQTQAHRLATDPDLGAEFAAMWRDAKAEGSEYGTGPAVGKRVRMVAKASASGFVNVYAYPSKSAKPVVVQTIGSKTAAPKAPPVAKKLDDNARLEAAGWFVHPEDETIVYNADGETNSKVDILKSLCLDRSGGPHSGAGYRWPLF